jgi:catechol 2,3-dioxygenase-like lactoylglutathione lyase family enzyme
MLLSAIPALPVTDLATAAQQYAERFGFKAVHQEEGFALLERDQVRIKLWQAGEQGWQRVGSPPGRSPVRTGSESFLAGTASCRIQVSSLIELVAELVHRGALHPTKPGPVTTWYGTREMHCQDADGNVLTFFEELA